MKTLRLEKKATFPKEKLYQPTFSHFVRYDSHQFAIGKGPQDLLKLLCKLKERFFKTHLVKGSFLKKNHLPPGKNGFGLFSWYYLWCCWKHNYLKKSYFGLRSFVLCSIQNLSEQFITAPVVSWFFSAI